MLAKDSIKIMGTVVDIQIESEDALNQVAQVKYLLDVYNLRFSANDNQSELMCINNKAGIGAISVHPDLFELITIGKQHSLKNPSNLNIALGPLVQSWRIGFSDAHIPSQDTISQAISLSNPKNILLNQKQQTVFLSQKGMKIDLGSLAKGYIADKIMTYLKSQHIQSALINLGGNVLVTGDNPKRNKGIWSIGIQNPQKPRGHNIATLNVKDKSVVTSGIYERYLNVDNQRYHHIFDRQTGYPIDTNMASLTIVSDLSVNCEIWTTRLFGLPLMEVFDTICKTPHIEGIIVTKDNRIAVTPALKPYCRYPYTS